MNTVIKFIKEQAKSIAAFFATYAANAIVSLLTGGVPWPQTAEEWAQYAVTTVSAAIAAWLARNKITQKQLDKDKNVVGGTVVDTPIATSGPTSPSPWGIKP